MSAITKSTPRAGVAIHTLQVAMDRIACHVSRRALGHLSDADLFDIGLTRQDLRTSNFSRIWKGRAQ